MILLTGGSGTLGKELQKQINCWSPNRKELDITWPFPFTYAATSDIMKLDEIGLIIHCAAYTDVLKAETEKELCYQTNVIGTRNLARLGIPMLYISTEYVFDGEKGFYAETDYPNPVNFYSLTKLLGEYESRRTRSVVIRCLFKPKPFEHERACADQWTSGEYVDVMAKEISLAVRLFDKLPPTLHIGFEKKSTYELANRKKRVQGCKLQDLPIRLPRDTSLDGRLWEQIKRDNQ